MTTTTTSLNKSDLLSRFIGSIEDDKIILAHLPNRCRSSSKTVAASSTGTAAAASLKIAKPSLPSYHCLYHSCHCFLSQFNKSNYSCLFKICYRSSPRIAELFSSPMPELPLSLALPKSPLLLFGIAELPMQPLQPESVCYLCKKCFNLCTLLDLSFYFHPCFQLHLLP
ncbi:uncharacterized protein DS421_18g630110 [Arachis hypogaea]|nr:uncharacterized protein DS421_18g630110 [Arachis hypogaea]